MTAQTAEYRPRRKAWRQLLDEHKPLVLPGAHDALCARLIERAGFSAYVIGGFGIAAARYGIPDIGLLGLSDMATGVRDIMAATKLPVLVDIDNGYGDVKNVVYTVQTYERLGVSALFLEDQVSPKRCGHFAGKAVVPAEVMEQKVRAAAAAREDPSLFLIARTDARSVNGLDDALRRAERYLRAGADGLFIEAPQSVAELEQIARAFDVPQFCNMLVGGLTPILTNRELAEMGYSMVVHGTTLTMATAKSIKDTLDAIMTDRVQPADYWSLPTFTDSLGMAHWSAIDDVNR